MNMGFGVPRPGFRKVLTLPLLGVTLGKSPNFLKPVLSVKKKKGVIIPHIICHNEIE